jgi:hypothetical protein
LDRNDTPASKSSKQLNAAAPTNTTPIQLSARRILYTNDLPEARTQLIGVEIFHRGSPLQKQRKASLSCPELRRERNTLRD